MLLSINWLRDYLQKSEVKINPEDLSEKLTMRGLAVEAIKHFSHKLDSVVVGKIVKIEPHPEADKLQITQVLVSAKENDEPITVVCGAKNIDEGDLVPVALPGAILPGEMKIKKSKIRGIESFGMICSGHELGVSEDTDGILQLPKHAKLGQPVAQLLGSAKEDTVLEFELTANRGDCLSVTGLAREIAPLLKTKPREPKPIRFRITPHRTSSIIKVEIEDPNSCFRYVARVLDNIKITESPDWIKERLESVGLRPINNIVDVTNFVMLETGQPLHAFDLRKISSGELRVATCKEPRPFETLTGETVQLEPGDILINDGETPVALAGIVGGANSQIADDTTSIILESASFPPGQIRRTAKRIGINTDSSKRFEKGTDPAMVAFASERAASLLRDSFNANVYHPPIDTNTETVKENTIAVDMRDVLKVTGLPKMSPEHASELLESIGIHSHKRSINILSVKLPSFRPDLHESIDIIEEIARLNGYDAIPQHFPRSPSAYDQLPEHRINLERTIRQLMVSMGFRETIHYSFTSDEILKKYGCTNEKSIALHNPISEEMKVMRPSLLPQLIETYLYNKNRKVNAGRLFELARTYESDDRSDTTARETTRVAGVLAGNLADGSWKQMEIPVDFYHAKGVVETLVRQITTVFLAYEPLKDHPLFHPNRSAELRLGLKVVGYVGEIHPYYRRKIFNSEEPVALFEVNLDALRKYERGVIRFKPLSKFPSISLDLSLLVDSEISSQALIDTIKKAGGELLEEVRLFDVYEGDKLPENKKSLGYHLNFLSHERTLKDEEVNALQERIVQSLAETHNAQLR